MREHGPQQWGPLPLHSVLIAIQAFILLLVHHCAQRAMLVLGQTLLERHRHFNVTAAMKGCFQPSLEQQATLLATHVLLGHTV